MKIGFAQINPTVGALESNARGIVEAYSRLCGLGAEMVVFPELAICGYPPRDLLFKTRFVSDVENTLERIARTIGGVPAFIGCVRRNPSGRGRACFNSAAFCLQGSVVQFADKSLLPTYDVFDEDRYFESAAEASLVEWEGWRIGVTICEDIWTGSRIATSRHYAKDPLGQIAARQPDLLLNLSASPWHCGKETQRIEAVVREAARRVKAPVAYCNMVGGNDELVFDGRSLLVRPDGSCAGSLRPFAEDLAILDTAPGASGGASIQSPEPIPDPMQDIHDALVLGLRDYAHKTGFKTAVIGLSGGIDSALTAVLACHALGAANVTGISLPSAISSAHSRDDARALAENLGIRFETLAIAPVVEAAEAVLSPLFAGLPLDVTEENIQARARGLLLMAFSNKTGALLLTTGNKSELAVGYCTLYGDMAGGLAVISDLPKTMVFKLCHWINREQEIIPHNTLIKPPSAELRPDQKDEDSLPPYDTLDAILHRYVELGQSRAEMVEAGFAPEVVNDIARKVDLNEYKRKQAAPGLKITPLAFGVGRRIPIVQRYVS